jgi:pilus assembly protein Flp/PilA
MFWISEACRRFGLDRRAVTAIEYVIIASLIALVIVGGVTAVGKNLPEAFNKVSSEL